MITNGLGGLSGGGLDPTQNRKLGGDGSRKPSKEVTTTGFSREQISDASKPVVKKSLVEQVKEKFDAGKNVDMKKLDEIFDYFEYMKENDTPDHCEHLELLNKGNNVFVIDESKTILTKISPDNLMTKTFKIEKYPIAEYLTEENPKNSSGKLFPVQEIEARAEFHPKNSPKHTVSVNLLNEVWDSLQE